MTTVISVPVDLVRRGAYQARRHFDLADLQDLADSISRQWAGPLDKIGNPFPSCRDTPA